MNVTITPGRLQGKLNAIPAKSYAHRELILAAFADKPTDLVCPLISDDIDATAKCLASLGANILRRSWGYHIIPAQEIPSEAVLPCGESGSTLRFLLPVVGALGVNATFLMEGNLGNRPLSPLWEEMERMGCRLTKTGIRQIQCSGKLKAGAYQIDAGISSQFITGLLLGLHLLPQKSTFNVTGTVQSAPYLDVTKDVLSIFGLNADDLGGQQIRSPKTVTVEGDWSNAAFFLAAHSLGSEVVLTGLNVNSVQGDREIIPLLKMLEQESSVISAAQIPDLIPILAVVAAAKYGALFTDIQRLRLKESDRVVSIMNLLNGFGIRAEATACTLQVFPGAFTGGTVSSCHDHRIAMAAAIAATIANSPVTVIGAESVSKSYPGFWDDFKLVGGQYELDLW